jgi:ABC-type Mn2+/Zn2+ transport system ATPase subunit
MPELLLNSLEIQGFRAFKHLRIPRLGRVNLIVGRNNSGKSSVLEAVRLYLERGRPGVIYALLQARGETARVSVSEAQEGDTNLHLVAAHLFHGRAMLSNNTAPIRIAPNLSLEPDNRTLCISFILYIEEVDEETGVERRIPATEILDPIWDEMLPGLLVRNGTGLRAILPLDESLNLIPRPIPFRRREISPSLVFVPPNGLNNGQMGQFWDRIALRDLETAVLNCLRIISPTVERITVMSGGERGNERYAVVRLKGQQEPVPLSSMGDGMTRLLHLALAGANAQDGVLLIDEVENGIHYSAQPDLWRLVFEQAQHLNIQVFATTHSLDCVTAFQQAAEENKEEEGVLIRLQHRKGEVEAILFDEDKLGFVTRQEIEVRG